jgi:hypothetical protein
MALPKLTAPEYTLELPSTGKKIKYRPFLVKEQKLLLTANEDDDEKEVIDAIKQVIKNCCLTKTLDVEDLPLFDIEYIFLQLRAKSVGEKATLFFTHQECPKNNNSPSKKQTEVEVDLSKIKIKKDPKHSTKIKLTNDVGIIMKYPKIELINTYTEEDVSGEEIFKLIGKCIEQIYDSEGSYSSTDYTPEELDDFISSMTESQFGHFKDFFETMPSLTHSIKFTCVECEKEEEIEVKGIQHFFT